jgi:WD40 repeat protein
LEKRPWPTPFARIEADVKSPTDRGRVASSLVQWPAKVTFMSAYFFDAHVVSALFDGSGAVFALGDGTVRFESGDVVEAHDGAALCCTAHPSGEGVVTGGDDGRLVWSRSTGPAILADLKGKWIDAVDASSESGLIAFSAGREVHVRDAADAGFSRSFRHERTLSALAFDPKGRRLAAATYGGAVLWYAKIAEQTPQMLKWAGSHIGAVWSPDGKFLISSMQESALHGWRLSDAKDMRMGGYPTKVRSLVFLANGSLMATSGAPGAVIWPFGGANGPMGKEAAEVGFDESATVVRVAAGRKSFVLAAGLSDGRIWTADLKGVGVATIRAETGPPISALAVSADGRRLVWGDEAGAAGISSL